MVEIEVKYVLLHCLYLEINLGSNGHTEKSLVSIVTTTYTEPFGIFERFLLENCKLWIKEKCEMEKDCMLEKKLLKILT